MKIATVILRAAVWTVILTATLAQAASDATMKNLWQRSEQGELQFYADHTVVGYPFEGTPLWEALAGNKIRITWSAERKVEYVFDWTWSSFHEADNAKAVFHVVQ